MRRMTKRRFVIAFSIFVAFILGVICIYNFCGKFSDDNIQNYQSNIDNIKGIGSFKIFPKVLDDDFVEKYSYKKRVGILQDKYQIYLECKYDAEKYAKEIDRLSNISDSYDGIKNNVSVKKLDEVNSAYVAISGFNDTYEYALVNNNDNTIRYIFLSFFKESQIDFGKKYYPSHSLTEIDSTNIYAYYDKKISGWYVNTGK